MPTPRGRRPQIGIAHRSYRLRRLESYLHRAEETKRYALAAQLLKQAAEEMGGSYSGRREITGKDGAPIGPSVVVYIPDNGGTRAFARRPAAAQPRRQAAVTAGTSKDSHPRI